MVPTGELHPADRLGSIPISASWLFCIELKSDRRRTTLTRYAIFFSNIRLKVFTCLFDTGLKRKQDGAISQPCKCDNLEKRSRGIGAGSKALLTFLIRLPLHLQCYHGSSVCEDL